jgi:hypothetical protein
MKLEIREIPRAYNVMQKAWEVTLGLRLLSASIHWRRERFLCLLQEPSEGCRGEKCFSCLTVPCLALGNLH